MFGTPRFAASLLAFFWIQIVGTLAQSSNSSGNSTGPPYTICDKTCQRQVKLLEGFILAVVLIMAVSVGVCCMHSVDTPTRFATPKDQRSHQE